MECYKFTIIIPHKNLPDLLQRCIDSIPQRDDLQVIIVDDNSNSEVVDFKHFPGLDRPNTEVYFDKSGKGAGRARNVGLEHAKGEWVLFSDSDDFYNTNNLNTLLDSDLDSYDVIAWLSLKLIANRKEIYLDFGDQKDNPEMLYRMNEPWRKMVRLSLIKVNQICFQESRVSNDLFFSKQVAYHCKHYKFHNDVIYNWQTRDGSTSSKYVGERLITALDVSIFVNKYLLRLGKQKYFDHTPYYMKLLWKESPLKFFSYLGKIGPKLGSVFVINHLIGKIKKRG